MRWNGAIQNDKSILKNNYSIQKFNNSFSKSSLNTNSNKELNLKSIQKIKQEGPPQMIKQMISTASHNNSQNNSNSKINKKFSKGTEIDQMHSTQSNDFCSNDGHFSEIDQVSKIVDYFCHQLSILVRNCFQRLEKLIQNKEMKEEFTKKLLKQANQIIDRKKQMGEQILAHLNLNSESKAQISKADVKDIQNKKDRKNLRVVMFKNDKVNQKNSFVNIEKSFEQINKVMEGRKPKFIRTSQTKRIDKSSDSSVEEIMEKSSYQHLKGNSSKMKVKQTLKKLKKILYE